MFPAGSMFPELFESQLIGLSVTPLLDMEADTGVTVSNVDKVDTWADQSGNGFNFTQTGTARPALATVGGYPAIQFDGIDDSLVGQNWATLDNMSSFTAISVVSLDTANSAESIISKLSVFFSPFNIVGWSFAVDDLGILQQLSVNYLNAIIQILDTQKHVRTGEYFGPTTVHLYSDGSNAGETFFSGGSISNYSSTDVVTIAKGIDVPMKIYAIRLYSPALNAAQRVAVEQQLANRYGVVL